ncbi:MAG TPA: gamma-glutamylcyclotransferase family protein [Solirubrobacteraceae bacterium]|nr:gamma-glutamylcyclotransferase family protein [Solirubrobacteraceae bacterium]
MDLSGHEFVFGYASLAALADGAAPSRTPAAGGFVCELRGHRRRWGVAMDNRRDLPGYKHYTEAAGARPAVFVCFLDIVADRDCEVNGLCVPVDAARLKALDERERNYERRDVSALVDAGGARVWAYFGRRAARRRMRRAAVAGRAVIDAGYLGLVTAGFRALGVAEWDACAPSLTPGALPVLALTRHDHA